MSIETGLKSNLLEVDLKLLEDIQEIFSIEEITDVQKQDRLESLLNSWLRLNLGVLGECHTQFPEHSYYHARIFRDQPNGWHECINWYREWKVK